jgi:hypothetical protein
VCTFESLDVNFGCLRFFTSLPYSPLASQHTTLLRRASSVHLGSVVTSDGVASDGVASDGVASDSVASDAIISRARWAHGALLVDKGASAVAAFVGPDADLEAHVEEGEYTGRRG